MDYRVQRLKEELTNAQQRNKKQRIQLANYKKCHERDLETIKKQKEAIDKAIKILEECKLLMPHEFDWEEQIDNILDILKEAISDKSS